MPLYEYKCVECDERFEVEQSMKAATLKTIKGEDHSHKVKKVFSPVGIAFKGSGFYKNDSAAPKKKTSPPSSSSDSPSSSSSSDKKSEPKKSPEKKSDAKAVSK